MQQKINKESQTPFNSNIKVKTFNQQIKENSCPNIWINQNSKISQIQSKHQKTSPEYQQIQLKIYSQSPSQSQQQILDNVQYKHRQLGINQRSFHHHDFEIYNFQGHSIRVSQKSKCKFDLNQFSQIKSRPSVKPNNSGSNQSIQKSGSNQNIQIKFGYQIGSSAQSQEKTFSKLKINSHIQKQKQLKENKSSIQKIRMSQNSQIVSDFNQSMKSRLSQKRTFDNQKYKNSDIKQQNEKSYKNLNIESQDNNENDLIKLISSRPIEFQSQQESSNLISAYIFDRIGISEQLKQFVGIINKILKEKTKNVDQFQQNQTNNYKQYKRSQNIHYLREQIGQKHKQFCHQQQLENSAEQILFSNGKYLIQIINFCTKNSILFTNQAFQYFKKLNKQQESDLQNQQDHNNEVHWSLQTLNQTKIALPRLCTLKQLIFFTSLFKIELFNQDQSMIGTKNNSNTQFMRQIQCKNLILNQKQLDEDISQLLKEHQQKKCSRCLNQNILKQNKSNKHNIDKKFLCINKPSILRHHLDDKTFLQYRVYIWSIFQCQKQDFLNLNQNLLQMEKQLNPIQKKFIKFIKGNNENVQFFKKSLQRLIQQRTNRNKDKNLDFKKGEIQNQLTQLKTIRNYKPDYKIQVKHKKQSLLQVKTFRLNYEQLRNATKIPVESKKNKSILNTQNIFLNYNQFYSMFAACNIFTKNQIIQLYKYLCCINDKKQYKITDANKLISLTILQQYANRSLQYQSLEQNIEINNQIKCNKQKIRNESKAVKNILSKQEKRGINISFLLKKQNDYKLYIQQLRQNKQKLMQIIRSKDKQISTLKKINLLSQVQFQNQIQILESTNKCQKQQMKRQYEQRITKLTESNRFQQQQNYFYRQQLQNLINEINYQSTLSNRYTNNKFKDENKSKQERTSKIYKNNNNGIQVNQNKNLVKIKIDQIRRKINQNNSILELSPSNKKKQLNLQFQQQSY